MSDPIKILVTGGTPDWGSFYQSFGLGSNGLIQTQAAQDQQRTLTSDPPTVENFTFKTLQNLFGPETTGGSVEGGESSTPFLDALKPEFQGGPTSGSLSGTGQGVGGMLEGLMGLIPRAAIIILGFVFVAAGLALFKDQPIVKVVTGKA